MPSLHRCGSGSETGGACLGRACLAGGLGGSARTGTGARAHDLPHHVQLEQIEHFSDSFSMLRRVTRYAELRKRAHHNIPASLKRFRACASMRALWFGLPLPCVRQLGQGAKGSYARLMLNAVSMNRQACKGIGANPLRHPQTVLASIPITLARRLSLH